MADPILIREQGNIAFKNGSFQEAIDRYTEALKILTEQQIDESIKNELTKCYSNRCQAFLNLNQCEDAIEDATRALELKNGDKKSLYRRATAFERLGKLNEAISDSQRLISLIDKKGSTGDEEIFSLCRRLREIAENKNEEKSQSRSQIEKMFEIVRISAKNSENAWNNLLVFSVSESGAETILQVDKNIEICQEILSNNEKANVLGVLRLFGSLVKNSYRRSIFVHEKIGLTKIRRFLDSTDDEICGCCAIFLQNLIVSICDLENRRQIAKAHSVPFNFDRPTIDFIDETFRFLTEFVDDKNVSASGRDFALDLILKFFDRARGCNWTGKLIVSGVPKVLRVASTVPQLDENQKKNYSISEQTKMKISCLLNAIFQDLASDSERSDFLEENLQFLKALKEKNEISSKVRTIAVLSVLLQGPFETGNNLISSLNLVELMLEMANSGDLLQQRFALEAIVLSASKKDKAAGILSQGAEILKELENSENVEIQVLALVGLAKIASSKGTDASENLMQEGTCQKLAQRFCKFLTTSGKLDIQRWSADGLAYLSLDAEVKEDLVENVEALKVLFQLCQSQDGHFLYSIVTIFVNLTNTYDVQKADKEMLELAKYAKQHVPKEHKKDAKEFFERRRNKLVEAGILPVLVNLCKQKSDNCRESISRIFLGLSENEKLRGPIVAAGGGKALLPLTSQGTEIGMTKSSQALAKIAITTNPEIAFPGQRTLELVRPFLKLLKIERSALENFEALMALTNLASLGEAIRKKILKESGFSAVEQYMFEEHPMLQRAATECMCNLVVQDEVVQYFVGENDRIKLLVLLCGDDDEPLIRAALGTLAVLSTLKVDRDLLENVDLDEEEKQRWKKHIEQNRIICDKIVNIQSFTQIFKELCACANRDLQFRAFYIIRNIVKVNKDLATKIVETDLMEILFALKDLQDEKLIDEKNRRIVAEIVEVFLQFGLIKTKADQN